MITRRQLDIWHIEAQEYADRIRQEFEQALNGTREGEKWQETTGQETKKILLG
jgi:hypothetical protein